MLRMKIPDLDPKKMVVYHIGMTIVWPLLLVPTLLWWKESVLWVATMSLYANFASHFAGYDAARAAVAAASSAEDAEQAGSGGGCCCGGQTGTVAFILVPSGPPLTDE